MSQKNEVLKLLRQGEQTYAGLNRALNFMVNCPYSVIRDLRRSGKIINDRYEKKGKSRYKIFTLIED